MIHKPFHCCKFLNLRNEDIGVSYYYLKPATSCIIIFFSILSMKKGFPVGNIEMIGILVILKRKWPNFMYALSQKVPSTE